MTTNIPGYEGRYKTLEFSANKRYGNRWSMVASYSYTWTQEYGNLYFNNRFATAVSQFAFFGSYPTNPNERTFNDFTNWNAKFSGTIDAGWDLRVTPMLQVQSGAPYGRFFQTRAGELNYGNQLILAEPIGTRRQETVSVFNVRTREKQLRFGNRARVGLLPAACAAAPTEARATFERPGGAWALRLRTPTRGRRRPPTGRSCRARRSRPPGTHES